MTIDWTLHTGDVLILLGGISAVVKLAINGMIHTVKDIKQEVASHIQADALAFQGMANSLGRLEERAHDIRGEQARVAGELRAHHEALAALQRRSPPREP